MHGGGVSSCGSHSRPNPFLSRVSRPGHPGPRAKPLDQSGSSFCYYYYSRHHDDDDRRTRPIPPPCLARAIRSTTGISFFPVWHGGRALGGSSGTADDPGGTAFGARRGEGGSGAAAGPKTVKRKERGPHPPKRKSTP